MVKLSKVNCKYGAPMGRVDQPSPVSGYKAIPTMAHLFNLRKVRLNSGGYDEGGAYWGLRSRGQTLYWAINETETIERFFDAPGREAAKNILREEFPNCKFYR